MGRVVQAVRLPAVTALDPFLAAANIFDPPVNPYLDRPVEWVRDRLGEHLWSKQVEILEAVRDHRRVAVHACHAAGKSFLAARAACWWLEVHAPGTAFVVSTAPKWEQVRAVLWREIGKAHRKGKLVGRVNQTEWWIGSEFVGYGRKPSDEDETGFQGIHAPYVLVVVDEASGIPEQLWMAVQSLMTTSQCRVLAIGNPDYQGSRFSKMCSPGSGWHVIGIDGFATPRFTDEPVPPDAPLLDQSMIDDIVKDYGADSAVYEAKVRGRFPVDNTDGIVPWSWANDCRTPELLERLSALRVPVELGVDVGAGGDLTVIRERCGPVAGRVWRHDYNDPEQVGDAVVQAVQATGATAVKIDYGGIGFGVTGLVRAGCRRSVAWPVAVHEVTFGASAKESDKFVNVRAELWWTGRELSRQRAWWLGDCDERTMADLCEPRWFEANDGRIQVEQKEQVRKRLGRSPDDGDALLLAFYDPPMESELAMEQYRDTRLRGRR